MLDLNNKGWLTGPDLFNALQLLGANFKKDEVYLFVLRYDRDNDGRLLYSDFCEAFSPRDPLSATLLSRRISYQDPRILPRFARPTNDAFFKMFKEHFSIETSNELLRRRLARRPNFTLNGAFSYCD